MANEINVSFSVQTTAKSAIVNRSFSTKASFTAAAPNIAGLSQSIPTTSGGTAIALGAVATPGVAYFINNDATNYVQIGIVVSATFYPLLKLFPGEGAAVRIDGGAVPYARANTAAVVLEYAILDN